MNLLKKLFQKPIQTSLTITSSNGFHLRPIAKFVNEVKKFDATIQISAKGETVIATQVPKLLSLSLDKGDTFTLKSMGKEAQEANTHLSNFFEELMHDDPVVEPVIQEEEKYESVTIRGITINKGVVIAPLAEYETHELSQDVSIKTTIKEAIKLTKEELYELYQANKTKDEAQIFLAQQALISSDVFRYNCPDIKTFRNIIKEQIRKLENTRFESRISDYLDVQQRVLSHLGISSILTLPSTPYILLADDLLPSDIIKLAETPIQGLILQKGTLTSHASILLRSFEIPSMIITKAIQLSRQAILDANSGDLILSPSQEDIQRATAKQQHIEIQRQESYENRFEPSMTKDKKEIHVLANVTDLASAKEAKENGASGIGLLRTEFLFTQTKPTLEEQTKSYREIFELFPNITIRTLDIGGDKSLPYINIIKEDNPFLGIRGIRFSLQEKELFSEQLLAIFTASMQVTRKAKIIKIMFPMVSEIDEFKKAKEIALNIAKIHHINLNNIQFGIMLEVPSVIFALKEFDALVDFYSIGTNDLTQYLFAIERTHPALTTDLTSPIVMNALKQIITTTTKPISICGELAGVEVATKPLIDMGYQTLSVSSKLIPELKERIRHV